MKDKIHPEYHETTITCACGEVIHTCSTRKNIRVEICSKCHPFFTGKQKLFDSAGRVEKFKRRYAKEQGREGAKRTGLKQEEDLQEETKDRIDEEVRKTPAQEVKETGEDTQHTSEGAPHDDGPEASEAEEEK